MTQEEGERGEGILAPLSLISLLKLKCIFKNLTIEMDHQPMNYYFLICMKAQ
jgi:hypothetical protein